MNVVGAFLTQTRIDIPVTVFRLVLSFIMGGVIGLEREWHRQSAGLRTHILISLGATMLTLLSIDIPQEFTRYQGIDPGRIAAQVISGIGFLGGGAIFRFGVNVRGLTTAASIWVVAGIGMLVGAGMYFASLVGTGLVLVALFVLVPFERRAFPDRTLRTLDVSMRGERVDTDGIYPVLTEYGIEVKGESISQSFSEKTVRLRLTVMVPDGIRWNGLYEKVGRVPGITHIGVDQKV